MKRCTAFSRAIPIAILALAFAACRPAPAPAPTETPAPPPAPAPEATPEWQPALLMELGHNGDIVEAVAFSPSGDLLASGLLQQVRLWDPADGRLIRSIEMRHSARDVGFSPDGQTVGAGLGVYGVALASVAEGGETRHLHGGFDNWMAFAPDGQTLATGNREGAVWLWDIASGEQTAELRTPDAAWITGLTYAPDGRILAAGHFDCTVQLWQIDDGSLLHTLERQGYACLASGLAFSPDGRLLAGAGAQDGAEFRARVWRVAEGSLVGDLPVASETTDVAFSPDGRILAVASRDGVTLWQVSDLSLLYTLALTPDEDGAAWATSLAFSPDGGRLAVGRWSGVLEVWQVQP